MNCDKCEKEIKTGEKYHCLSYSIEKIIQNEITVEHSEMVAVSCLECGPKGILKRAVSPKAEA